MVLDGLLNQRARLTAVKYLTNYGGFDNWLHGLLVNRALKRNLRFIRMHECPLCQVAFRRADVLPADAARELFVKELALVQQNTLPYLNRELNEGLIDESH